MPNKCPTELDQQSLLYIIDLARTTKSPKNIIDWLNSSVQININGTKRALNWNDGGLNYTKELCEIILPMCD